MELQRGELISQGAEGKVYESSFVERPCIEKVRLSKRYRAPEIDVKLNKQRILQETRCIVKCLKAGILVPSIYFVDLKTNRIILEKIIGDTCKQYFYSQKEKGYGGECLNVAKKIGEAVGKMHDANIVHGDLTSSNMMLRFEDMQVVLIDFGLGSMQSVVEDKAVDLYVLERAMLSTHPGCEAIITAILQAYRFSCRQGTIVLNKLEQVRQRGRKREMIG